MKTNFTAFKLGYKSFIQLVVVCGYGLNVYYILLDRQPTRLLRPWDLPGKSTGVGNMQQGGSKKKKGKKESAAAQERERRERLDQLFQTWKMEVARECRQPLKIGKTRDNFSPRASRRNVVLPTP